MCIKLQQKSKVGAIYKIIALFTALYSAILVGNETFLIFGDKEAVRKILQVYGTKIWFTFSFTSFVTLTMVGYAFFTIFKLKFSDYI
jgi:hypothetical protein